jgi:hypothetical protein
LERQPCPWIVSWAGQSEASGFRHGSSFGISVQTRSIAILTHQTQCTTEYLISVAHQGQCVTEYLISVVHQCHCATESLISVAHVAQCATKIAKPMIGGGRVWPHLISVAHGFVVRHKNKLFLWRTMPGAPQKLFLWRICSWCATEIRSHL